LIDDATVCIGSRGYRAGRYWLSVSPSDLPSDTQFGTYN